MAVGLNPFFLYKLLGYKSISSEDSTFFNTINNHFQELEGKTDTDRCFIRQVGSHLLYYLQSQTMNLINLGQVKKKKNKKNFLSSNIKETNPSINLLVSIITHDERG